LVDLSRIGAEGIVWLAIALFLAALRRRPLILVMVAAADLAADGLAFLLREAIGRERPPLVYPEPEPLVRVPHQPAFPSGHAATAFACATVIAWFAPRLRIPAFVLAAAIAWSRVYVGVHWPLDVLGGAALGTAVGAVLVFLARRWRFRAGGDSARGTAPESTGPPLA
jgi:undecaprenyl-diphosphatase